MKNSELRKKMESVSKEIFEVEYEIITPTHIGNGQKLPKTELGYFPSKGIIRRINIDKFFEAIPAHKIGELSKTIRIAKNDYFNNILKSEKLTPENLQGDYDLTFLYPYHEDEINKIREFNTHIKTPFFNPYIPGSSLKGWLRTAILFFYLKRLKEAKNKLEDFNKKLDHLPRGGKKLYYEKRDMRKILEDDIFGSDPREDIFRFITLTDTNPVSPEHLQLGLINIFHPTIKGRTMIFEPLGFSIFAELLNIGTKFTGKVILNKDLKKYKHEYLHSNTKSAKIREFILNDLIAHNREDLTQKICDLNNHFSKNIINFNYGYLTKLREEIESSQLDHLITYYKNKILPLYKHIKESRNQFLIRLGFSTEWTSKTVGIRILDYFQKERETPYDFSTFYDRINRLQLFKGQRMHKHFELTPISRAYIVNHTNNPQYPLGWIKVQIKD